MQPQEITALAAVIGVVIASVSAGAAVWSTRNTAKALKDAETRGIQQVRPIVVAELRKHRDIEGTLKQGMQDLVITNYGSTPARHLRITFDPLIPDPVAADLPAGTVTSSMVRRLGKTVPTLAPGAELVNIYMVGRSVLGRFKNDEPVPDQVTVKVIYEDMGGREYIDRFPLDVDEIGLSTFSQPTRR